MTKSISLDDTIYRQTNLRHPNTHLSLAIACRRQAIANANITSSLPEVID